MARRDWGGDRVIDPVQQPHLEGRRPGCGDRARGSEGWSGGHRGGGYRRPAQTERLRLGIRCSGGAEPRDLLRRDPFWLRKAMSEHQPGLAQASDDALRGCGARDADHRGLGSRLGGRGLGSRLAGSSSTSSVSCARSARGPASSAARSTSLAMPGMPALERRNCPSRCRHRDPQPSEARRWRARKAHHSRRRSGAYSPARWARRCSAPSRAIVSSRSARRRLRV